MQVGGGTVVEAKINSRDIVEFSCAVFCITTGLELAP